MKLHMHFFALIGCAIGLASPAATLGQGSKVISAVPENHTEIRTDSDIDVLAYHCLSSGLDQAEIILDTEPQYGKPIIISDDGSPVWSQENPDNMYAALQLTMQHGQHFEHLDKDTGDYHECLGIPIDGIEDFTARSLQHLQYLSQYSQSLPYPGTLIHSGGKLYWNGQEIHLVGFSSYETVATPTTYIPGYMDVLASYHINFTRIFITDRWANMGCSYTPFRLVSGDRCPGSKFDIAHPDDATYFARLREYVTQAWQHGMVVQLCIFDRCGLQSGPPERWGYNPYNVANNINTRFTLDGSNYPPAFTQTTGDVAVLHSALLNKIVATVGDCGNVIYEIMNEPLNSFPNIPGFHSWVADTLRTAFDTNATQVSIDLGSPDMDYGMTHPQHSDGDTTPLTIGGRSCRKNVDPGQDFYFYFGVNDIFAYQGSKPDLYIMIDYYDTGTGSLTLQYDAADTIYKNGGSVTLTATNTWKQAFYHVTDAYFGNRQNGGADFRIFGGVGNVFYLDIVAVSVNSPLPPKASGPDPAHQATGVSRTAGLSWMPVEGATSYDVYFGLSSPPGFQGSQSQTTFDPPGTMDPLTVYYWRIDPVNGFGATTGDIWHFTTVSYPGDFDEDLDVDQEDFGQFQKCYSGAGIGYSTGCEAADLDPDGDVDLADFAVFLGRMSGANKPPGG